MFQATRRRLTLWYAAVTAVLLLLFASGIYFYVRATLVERVDDTLSHVIEVVMRSLVVEPDPASRLANPPSLRLNLEASFRGNADAVEDDHIDLEWFDAAGNLQWSTFSSPLLVPLHVNPRGETVIGETGKGEGETGKDGKGETVSVLSPDWRWDEAGNLDKLDPADRSAAALFLPPSPLVLRQITQPVEVNQQRLGYLRVSHPWFEVTKPSREFLRDLVLGTLLMVGVVTAIGWLLSGLAMAPIRDSYQRLRQFTADASHELRNPIAVIQTNVQVALADPDPHLQQDQLQLIERLTRRLGRLVDDLLFLARQDGGNSLRQQDSLSLKLLLSEVVEEQQTLAIEKALSLKLELAPEDPKDSSYALIGDRDQLTRLFTNLVSNAVQYTPAQGSVWITLGRSKSAPAALQVQVQDTGIGIPPEALPHLFDRFYRVDPARTPSTSLKAPTPRSTSGSGLGLAIAKAIVENHQGQIQIHSTIQQGTIVTVTLPRDRFEAGKSAMALEL